MKIRKGFVSNSSSSSFVLGIAEVVNEEKLKESLAKHKIGSYSYEIVSYNDFEFSSWSGVKVTDSAKLNKDETVIKVDAFDGSEVSLPFDKTKKYFVYCHSEDCGCNEDGEAIFNDTVCDEIDLISANTSDSLSNLHTTEGCGYNG